MIGNAFDRALEELSKEWGIPLKADSNNSCLVKFADGLEIQIEPFDNREELLICAPLGNVPSGRYREDLFRTALIENGHGYPNVGILSYSEDSQNLILFEHLPFQNLTQDQLVHIIKPFKQRALKWKQAIETGHIPPIHEKGTLPSIKPKSGLGL